ncbi:hypothetical protein SAMN05192551_102316 [Tindallia magadiensis]|uniref:Uncharacterized protein n=1 Tax=Tindallia magadiensis TaxID=69895 RepID=A0A1I3CBX8_9FIRM|nr:hypothetical protein SAMN05192551_102316 [Tindallia magadiensis]
MERFIILQLYCISYYTSIHISKSLISHIKKIIEPLYYFSERLDQTKLNPLTTDKLYSFFTPSKLTCIEFLLSLVSLPYRQRQLFLCCLKQTTFTSILQLLNYSTTQLLNYSTTQLLNYSTTQLLNYSTTQLLNYFGNPLLPNFSFTLPNSVPA